MIQVLCNPAPEWNAGMDGWIEDGRIEDHRLDGWMDSVDGGWMDGWTKRGKETVSNGLGWMDERPG